MPLQKNYSGLVSTHSRPKAAGYTHRSKTPTRRVSTHSRPKAAGCYITPFLMVKLGFNTQPPEGGWRGFDSIIRLRACVSTHSRPKAAGGFGYTSLCRS